nr:SufD family Fe-S cluster assembly protein [Planctomycetota bacterium]
AARSRAQTLGLPTNTLESWRYVRLAPLAKPPTTARSPLGASAADRARLPGIAAVLVLVDGAYRADLSNLGALPSGLRAQDLLRVEAAEGERLVGRWSSEIASATDVTACWSFADGGGGLCLTAEGAVPAPVHIISIVSGGISGARVSIELGRAATVDLAITHLALGAARSSIGFDVGCAAGSVLRVDETQFGPASAGAQVFGGMTARLSRDAQLTWNIAACGSELTRFTADATLAEVNSAVALSGTTVLDGTRQLHNHVRVRHQVGPTTSTQLFKTIADGSSTASFDGLVAIAKGADGSQATQRNNNLLLSPSARVDTRPQLDILADDVKAGHGATVGRLDADELFYLRTRGLDAGTARAVLTRAFAAEVIELMHLPAMRELAQREILGALGR